MPLRSLIVHCSAKVEFCSLHYDDAWSGDVKTMKEFEYRRSSVVRLLVAILKNSCTDNIADLVLFDGHQKRCLILVSRNKSGRQLNSLPDGSPFDSPMLKTFDSFRSHCRLLEGTVLHTAARNRPFRIEIEGNAVFFIPESSGKRRTANSEKTERVLALLAESNEWSPGKYQTITYHASYILAIARHAEASRVWASPTGC